jgi:lactate dehydrogenase-like 2-hydroxyacid dehydrogenase
MKPQVLVTKRIYTEAVEYLKQHWEVDDVGEDAGLTADQLRTRLIGRQAVVSQLTDRFSANVAVGFDNIDVPAATRKGILVTNTPDVLTETTADFAFALLLAAARRVVEGHQFVLAGEWKKWAIDLLVGHDVHHKILGLFGMGRIGQAVARRGRGFSMRIVYHDAVRAQESIERELGLEFVSKEELLREADFVSLHVPLLDSTRKLIGEPQLKLMKKTAILVNTARGQVVDEAALATALAQGWIAGAVLDVFEREPEVTPELLRLPNVIVAPHIASASVDARREMSMLAARNVVEALEGRRPFTLLNPAVWDALSLPKGA